jgi:hypothetical protein
LLKPTYHILPNTLSVSGINSDSDHQLEWKLTKRDLTDMLLPVLLKMILSVMNKILETEPYLSSSNLGILMTNQPTLSVLMILKETCHQSVNKSNSNILKLMVTGSMSILVTLLKNLLLMVLSLDLNTTKLLLFQKYSIELLQLNYNSISELLPVWMLSMVTSIMLNSIIMMVLS